MPWHLYILVFATTVLLVLLIYEAFFLRKQRITERLEEIKKMETEAEEESELHLPFMERLVKPFFRNLGNVLGNLAPQEIKSTVEKKLSQAGRPGNMSFNNFAALQVMCGVLAAALALLIFGMFNAVGERITLLVVVIGLLGLYIPYFVISSRAQTRQDMIQKKLPDTLDLLLVSVEAGLGFDMALKRVTDSMPGILSEEIRIALEEIRLGRTRNEALRGIVKRTGVPDLSSFVSAVIQAEQLGSNIARTLRIQADSMRQKRRQRAEEQAMKAPIKMLFPLVFFIFPTLFVVLLGPAFIQIMQAFTDTF